MQGAAWGQGWARGTGGSGWLVSHPGVMLFIYGLGPGPGTHKAARGELRNLIPSLPALWGWDKYLMPPSPVPEWGESSAELSQG